MQLHFNSISEPTLPGVKWKKLFDSYWPAYAAWLNSKGAAYVPDLQSSQAALKKYMPKMWPTYEHLCKLTNADSVAARFLTGFQPPAYISACSQAVLSNNGGQLVRNYDYHPDLMEGTLLLSAWNGKKVIATSDCLIGAVDGMNEDGLAISLTFGGRKVVGKGFGIPFILRYVLEFCSTVEEAVETLSSIPSHMAYNVTVIDRSGVYKTVLLSPDREPIITDAAFTTNHQETIDWPENASFTKTLKRSAFLNKLLEENSLTAKKLSDAFLKPPLYTTLFDQGFGTLYTAVYDLTKGSVQLRWPDQSISVSFDSFKEEHLLVKFNQPVLAPMPRIKSQKPRELQETSTQGNWQDIVADILVNSMALPALTEKNEELKTLRQNITQRGEISWELLADYWANIGKEYWKKWQN